MLQVTTSPLTSTPLLLRVRAAIGSLGCGSDRVWARSSGGNVLLGLSRSDASARPLTGADAHVDAYARIVPLGNGSYGLAFRAVEACSSHTNAWEPLLLVDELHAVVEHALIAVDAIPADV
jgi:hypothetical protein